MYLQYTNVVYLYHPVFSEENFLLFLMVNQSEDMPEILNGGQVYFPFSFIQTLYIYIY
jgi:hypothetical protein